MTKLQYKITLNAGMNRWKHRVYKRTWYGWQCIGKTDFLDRARAIVSEDKAAPKFPIYL